jgi:hypothetical protein
MSFTLGRPSRSNMNERGPSLRRRPALPQRRHCVIERVCDRINVDGLVFEELLVEVLGDERTIVVPHGPVQA